MATTLRQWLEDCAEHKRNLLNGSGQTMDARDVLTSALTEISAAELDSPVEEKIIRDLYALEGAIGHMARVGDVLLVWKEPTVERLAYERRKAWMPVIPSEE